jgi:hypothetical protein
MDVKFDDKNNIRRLRRLETTLQKTGEANVEQIGRWTRDRLRLFIPKNTGASAKSIMLTNMVKGKKLNSITVSVVGNPHNRKWRGYNFLLPQWFMQSEKARINQRKYSGNINEYRRVIPEARRIFATRIRDDIKNATKTLK